LMGLMYSGTLIGGAVESLHMGGSAWSVRRKATSVQRKATDTPGSAEAVGPSVIKIQYLGPPKFCARPQDTSPRTQRTWEMQFSSGPHDEPRMFPSDSAMCSTALVHSMFFGLNSCTIACERTQEVME
jgi:hypothetical protein